MALWKIEPLAGAEDSRWLDHPIWEAVVVRAPSPAHARLLAAEMERSEASVEAPPGNESLAFRSAFEDEKLYRVRRLRPGEEAGLAAEGPEEVVRATRLGQRAAEVPRGG